MLRNVKKVTRRLHLHITLHLMAAAVKIFLLPQRNDNARLTFIAKRQAVDREMTLCFWQGDRSN